MKVEAEWNMLQEMNASLMLLAKERKKTQVLSLFCLNCGTFSVE